LINCLHCGGKISELSRFCPKCGEKIIKTADFTSNPNAANFILQEFKFFKIGTFYNNQGSIDRRLEEGIGVSDRLPLVYAMVVDEEIMYIGETIQGYKRPLNYHTNEKMSDVRNGILDSVSRGLEVNVFARTTELEFEFEGLPLNLRVSLEAALIKKYTPPWNKKIEK